MNEQALSLLALCGATLTEGTVLLAQEGEVVLGVAVVRLGAPDSEVLALVTDPNHRHRGIGRQLVLAMGERARKAGSVRLRVHIAHRDDALVTFFRGLGFDDTHLALDLPL